MIAPTRYKNKFKLFGDEQINEIHRASMTILEKTGVVMPLASHRYELLMDKGARVDPESKRVYLPEKMVLAALEAAPSVYKLFSRSGEDELVLDGNHGYLTLDGTGVGIQDVDSGALRSSSFQDLCDAVRVADALPQISFLWPCLSSQDKPPHVQPLYELYAMLKNSGKHIQAMTAADPVNARGTVEMASAVAGGKENLRHRPIISNFQCSISPLSYDEKGLEAALVFAEAGVPVGFLNMPIGCATAPATIAGNIAMGNAEILAGIVFLQILYPGAPTFYGSCATMMELRRGGITAGGPYDFLLQAGAAQMARYYGLPSNVGTFATGAKTSDWQAGVENAVSGAVSMFCGADMMSGAGLIRGATVFSFAQLLLDVETYDILKHVVQGIEVNEDTLAIDVVDRVGPGNHYMMDEHTLRHMRELWQPSFIDFSPYDQWIEKGSPSSPKMASEKARAILKSHGPAKLEAEDRVLEILREYEKRFAAEDR